MVWGNASWLTVALLLHRCSLFRRERLRSVSVDSFYYSTVVIVIYVVSPTPHYEEGLGVVELCFGTYLDVESFSQIATS